MQDTVTAIRNRLIAAGFTAGSIWYEKAPAEQAYPYFLIHYIAGGDENFTEVDTRNEVYQVKTVDNSATRAKTNQASIKNALHKQENALSVSGHGVMWCRAETPFFYSEDIADQQIYHAGYRFRVRIYETD